MYIHNVQENNNLSPGISLKTRGGRKEKLEDSSSKGFIAFFLPMTKDRGPLDKIAALFRWDTLINEGSLRCVGRRRISRYDER